MAREAVRLSQSNAAIAFKISSGLSLVIVALLAQILSTTLPIGQIIFFRSAGMVVAVLCLGAVRDGIATCWRTQRIHGHLGRSTIGGVALMMNFSALSLLPLAEAQALMYLAPLFVVLLGIVFLKEPSHYLIWFGVILGFLGTSVILNDGAGTAMRLGPGAATGVAIGIAGALFSALSMVQARTLAPTERPSTMAFYFGLTSMVGALLTCGLGWSWPSIGEWGMLAAISVAGAVGHLYMAEALARAPVGYLAPFDYLNITWAVLLAGVVLSQWPSLNAAVGIGCVILATACATLKKA